MIRLTLASGIVLGLTLWAYQPTWRAHWVYEDAASAAHAETIRATRWATAWTWRVAPTPLRAHALNLGLHLTLGALLGVLAWRLGWTPVGAVVASAIWWLHPLTVETAAYATGRTEQIALLGILLALLCATGAWWRPVVACGLLGGLVLAVGGKEAGIIGALLVPLVVATSSRRREDRPGWAGWPLPASVVMAGIVGAIWAGGGLRAVVNADTDIHVASVFDVTWWEWGLAQGGAVWYWVVATVWPAWLTPDADIDGVAIVWRVAGLGVLGFAAAWAVQTRTPPLRLALGWFVLALVPRLLVQTPRSYLNAHQFSLAFMAIALLAGYGAEQWRLRWTPHGR